MNDHQKTYDYQALLSVLMELATEQSTTTLGMSI
jgi:hypothetical protein